MWCISFAWTNAIILLFFHIFIWPVFLFVVFCLKRTCVRWLMFNGLADLTPAKLLFPLYCIWFFPSFKNMTDVPTSSPIFPNLSSPIKLVRICKSELKTFSHQSLSQYSVVALVRFVIGERKGCSPQEYGCAQQLCTLNHEIFCMQDPKWNGDHPLGSMN